MFEQFWTTGGCRIWITEFGEDLNIGKPHFWNIEKGFQRGGSLVQCGPAHHQWPLTHLGETLHACTAAPSIPIPRAPRPPSPRRPGFPPSPTGHRSPTCRAPHPFDAWPKEEAKLIFFFVKATQCSIQHRTAFALCSSPHRVVRPMSHRPPHGPKSPAPLPEPCPDSEKPPKPPKSSSATSPKSVQLLGSLLSTPSVLAAPSLGPALLTPPRASSLWGAPPWSLHRLQRPPPQPLTVVPHWPTANRRGHASTMSLSILWAPKWVPRLTLVISQPSPTASCHRPPESGHRHRPTSWSSAPLFPVVNGPPAQVGWPVLAYSYSGPCQFTLELFKSFQNNSNF
jgi:hypothetical protein